MSLSNAQFEAILRTYEERQLKNRHILIDRNLEVENSIPSWKDIEETISSVSIAQGKKLLSGDDDALEELKSILRDLNIKKRELLKSAGFPSDYLSPIYDCPDCKDTGYINGTKCHCLKQAITKELYSQSNIQQMLQKDNFSSLSYEYYDGEDLARFTNAVKVCRQFVENFNVRYHNLFFCGTVGTGKSFLSGCVAKELLDKGYSVIYFSAPQLFETITQHSFDYKNRESLNDIYTDIYNCDLLIIDDLGTETSNKLVSTQLFSCMNERHLRMKPTIISTNLSLEELLQAYSERIFSRITNQYELLRLTGSDIRMQIKRKQSRK